MERDLIKKELSCVQAKPEEMDLFRENLKRKLEQRHKGWTVFPPNFGIKLDLRLFWLAVPITSVLLLTLYILPERVNFKQVSLDEIQQLVFQAQDQDTLKKQANLAMRKGTELERMNATLVLCLLLPANQSKSIIMNGIEKETRPEFRAVYLEYLLDFAEQFPLSQSKVEQLIDSETDPHCQRLYKIMLRSGRVS